MHVPIQPILVAAPLAAALAVFAPTPAQACGGTFCDNTGGIPMPVDQRGEDILFIQDGPEIEVHVRIQYTGEAEHFAWLVPLQNLPEISVGSDMLFAQLGVATFPVWQHTTSYECEGEEPGPSTSIGFVPDEDFGGGGPEELLNETVGAFDVVVLQGGTASEVLSFLETNGYEQDPEAEPILQEYLDEGFLFAAVKLTANADVAEIHPLVFRMPGDEPCVPLRLTRIAAEPDMGVRAYFLGSERWAPQNYEHVVLNPLAFPWSQVESSSYARERYVDMVSAAVDEAGGKAFVTDFAGGSEIVDTTGVYEDTWDETAFVGVDPIQAIDLIAIQNLATHPLIQPLLMEFIPPPDGVSPFDFWNNIEDYADLIDDAAWDSQAFADALAERIIDPGLRALDLLDAWPYLTRLHTTISPEEMSVDPIFLPAPALPEVPVSLTTNELDLCGDAGSTYSVPFDGGIVEVCLAELQNAWPFPDIPAALRIEKIPLMGPAQLVVDNKEDILAAVSEYQQAQGCEPPAGGEEGGDEGGAETSGGPGADDDAAQSSCGCTTDEGGPLGLALGALGLLLLRTGGGRRARREREPS